MDISYNLTGAGCKALVQAISEILGKPAVYQGAPTFAYAIGSYIVDKTGTLTYPENTDPEEVRQLVSQLRGRSYTPENDNVFTVEMPRAGFTAMCRCLITSRKSSPVKRSCSRELSGRTQWTWK